MSSVPPKYGHAQNTATSDGLPRYLIVLGALQLPHARGVSSSALARTHWSLAAVRRSFGNRKSIDQIVQSLVRTNSFGIPLSSRPLSKRTRKPATDSITPTGVQPSRSFVINETSSALMALRADVMHGRLVAARSLEALTFTASFIFITPCGTALSWASSFTCRFSIQCLLDQSLSARAT